MTNKDAASRIRTLAIQHLATTTEIAEKLMALADSLDPPAWKPDPPLACDVCGQLITAIPAFDGDICGKVEHGKSPCPGRFRAARTMGTTRSDSCTCDVCGDQIEGLRWFGEGCEALFIDPSTQKHRRCCGYYRLDPEPDEELTTVDGQSLGVTRDELVIEAVRDYVHGDEVPGIDMASTYGGRS